MVLRGTSSASIASSSLKSNKTEPRAGSLEEQIKNISLEEENQGPVIKRGESGDQ